MTERLRVTIYDGKYTVIMNTNGGLRALRYGDEWRDLTGDGLVLALAQEVEELREKMLLASAYIQYVQKRNPDLHREADGSPSIEAAIAAATGKEAA